MARFHDPHDGLDQLRRLPLAVVPLLDDPVEELAARAQLHDQVHEERVLVGALDPDHIGVLREVVHDLDLAPHVLVVIAAEELDLGDGLARVLLPVVLVDAEVRGAELPLPELLPNAVMVPQVWGLVREDRRVPGGAMGRTVDRGLAHGC